MAGAVNPVPAMAAMLAWVIGLCSGTLTKVGIPAVLGNPLIIDNITTSSTPAVPRSKRLSSNLTAAEEAALMLCPGINPTKDPAAT